MKKVMLSIAAAAILIFPVKVLACACCADAGAYSIRTERPTEYDLELLNGMKFGKIANLYLTEADSEMIKGLEAIKPELDSGNWMGDFGLESMFGNKAWTFNLVSKAGKKGSLVLPIPTQVLKFKVDLRDGREGGGGGPLLYKEFRFKGRLRTSSGFFRPGTVSPATYFLVFQGRGNYCDNTEDFSSWRLEINGPKADYAFYGDLTSGPARDN